jgi:hypothetical protein
MIPGESRASIHFLDARGRHEAHCVFCTGYRIDINDAALVDNALVGARVIEITTSPAINGGDIRRQVYGIFPSRVALLRLEDSRGKLVANYGYPNPYLGPSPPARTADEWEQLLASADRTVVLEALTWISGEHQSVPADSTDSDKAAALLIAAVRKRPTVNKRIMELTTSANPWLREAALLARQQLPGQAIPKE